jgi:signal transduction histidine kinase/DNA-binding response OmpR family regulator
LEADPEFRASLTEVMHAGLRWGGGALVLGALVHLGIEVGGRGKSMVWLYTGPTGHEIAVLYHIAILGVGAGLIGLPRIHVSLGGGRLAVAVTILMACSFSIHDDLLRGATISIAFVVMVYMSILVMVPFRPWQATAIGGGIVGGFWLLTDQGLFLPAGAVDHVQGARKAAELMLAVGLGTAMSVVLYASRYVHHRVRTEAQQDLEAARDEAQEERARAEDALATVQAQAKTLRELDEMKSRFFANISHELRTPLSLMLDPVRRMIETDRPADEVEQLRLVYRNARRLHRLVRQLLDLARHDANQLDLDRQHHDWPSFVQEVTGRLVPMAEAEGVSFSVEAPPADEPVPFDPDRMETVVANLVRNALRYTPRGGTVHVEAAVTAAMAVLRVTDDGPGIPEAEQDALFDRFYRGAGTSEHPGTGIGLSLTNVLVTAHDGTLSVDSTVGQGSTFTVRWPVGRGTSVRSGAVRGGTIEGAPREPAADPPALAPRLPWGSAPEGSSPNGRPASPDRTTILIVEDHMDVRSYLRGLLEPHYHVQEATNGEEGLLQARATLPDLVVTDVMMPERTGMEMVQALRRSERTDGIPVVMLTARADVSDQVAGLVQGADAYVTKPFDADVLIAQIERLISARRQLRKRLRREAPPAPGAVAEAAPPASFDKRLRAAVRAHLSDPDLTVEQLAEQVGLARRTVTRKTKEAFGQTPSSLIRSMRLDRGAKLLKEDAGTVSEVAYAVGFNSLSYFSRCFKDHFGVSPTEYRNGPG